MASSGRMYLRRGLSFLGALRRPFPGESFGRPESAGWGQRAVRWGQGQGGRGSESPKMVIRTPWEDARGWAWSRSAIGGCLAAFSLFSKPVEEEKGESSEAEDQIIFLLKKAKLSIMKGELEGAEQILHQSLLLAQQSDNKKAITYTYDLMANLAFVRGELINAEKLYKAVMSNLLASGTPQDDDGIIEMSLKLAMIYAAQNQHQLALAGYQFCILTLEEKMEKQKDLPENILTAAEKSNTRLLLGMSLDSYGRYLLANKQLSRAQSMYEKALKICREEQGETHPQTLILMNDLAMVMDAQGAHDNAYIHAKRALELARQTEHPEQHIMLGNLAGILMHKESFAEAQRIYEEALKQAEQKGDIISVKQIQEGLAELARRRGS
ncbi:tetratricopeptide repeat protein 19, mitochondrial [Rhinatrema bivittatum]|uniref:tetratricopeptide repeat protein 19, mitochondrial n=1 Tax=Rhinatrema bivittatum TaxID=194408 RepID=UPI001128DE30|nr:tetratricopeptide repeat protein 19, mitochondrial [Rhinatrema bivittatum]